MRLGSLIKKIAQIKEKVQKGSKYDRINLADEVRARSPLAKQVVDRTARIFVKQVLGEDITVMPEDFDTNQQASLAIQELVFTSVESNPAANLISIEIIADSAEDIFVDGTKIYIYINDGVSDSDSVKALVDADEQASSLVSVEVNAGQGATVVIAEDEQSLSGAIG